MNHDAGATENAETNNSRRTNSVRMGNSTSTFAWANNIRGRKHWGRDKEGKENQQQQRNKISGGNTNARGQGGKDKKAEKWFPNLQVTGYLCVAKHRPVSASCDHP